MSQPPCVGGGPLPLHSHPPSQRSGLPLPPCALPSVSRPLPPPISADPSPAESFREKFCFETNEWNESGLIEPQGKLFFPSLCQEVASRASEKSCFYVNREVFRAPGTFCRPQCSGEPGVQAPSSRPPPPPPQHSFLSDKMFAR